MSRQNRFNRQSPIAMLVASHNKCVNNQISYHAAQSFVLEFDALGICALFA